MTDLQISSDTDMAPKTASDTKAFSADQIKLLVEVHKRANIAFTAEQWEEIATVVSSKNGKAA